MPSQSKGTYGPIWSLGIIRHCTFPREHTAPYALALPRSLRDLGTALGGLLRKMTRSNPSQAWAKPLPRLRALHTTKCVQSIIFTLVPTLQVCSLYLIFGQLEFQTVRSPWPRSAWITGVWHILHRPGVLGEQTPPGPRTTDLALPCRLSCLSECPPPGGYLPPLQVHGPRPPPYTR